MRERTPFPRGLFAALPKLKLLLTSGMRNAAIDMEAAKAQGSWSAARNIPAIRPRPLTMGLILELTRDIGRENARMHAGEPWQNFAGVEIEGTTLGVVGLGKLGSKMAGIAKSVRHERDRLEPEPHAGEVRRRPASATPPRRSCSPTPTSSPSMWC